MNSWKESTILLHDVVPATYSEEGGAARVAEILPVTTFVTGCAHTSCHVPVYNNFHKFICIRAQYRPPASTLLPSW